MPQPRIALNDVVCFRWSSIRNPQEIRFQDSGFRESTSGWRLHPVILSSAFPPSHVWPFPHLGKGPVLCFVQELNFTRELHFAAKK